MKKYHIFHLDTNEDTPGNVLQPWMGEYNFSDWKKTQMNYIIINKTKNISDFGNYSKYTSTC